MKFATCGSVDDGKSTLIGRLLYDAGVLYQDQCKALQRDSMAEYSNNKLDFSLLLDGLTSEREQKITIDVAYRYFSTSNRSFIVADCPGHEQYTKNMAVGASFSSLAVLLTDVRRGVTEQTKRHLQICAFMGIRCFVLAVNKMDLVSYDQEAFERVKNDFMAHAAQFRMDSVYSVPVSAIKGDNVVNRSNMMPWFGGQSLLTYLEQIVVREKGAVPSFVLPVQRVSKSYQSVRTYQGHIESGEISLGDEIQILPGRERASVSALWQYDREVKQAFAGQAVALKLDKEVSVPRGSVFAHQNTCLEIASNFRANVLWIDDEPLNVGKVSLMKCGTKTVNVKVTKMTYPADAQNITRISRNEIAQCEFSSSQDIAIAAFEMLPSLGSFILIDKISHMTSGCGVILSAINSSTQPWKNVDNPRATRALLKGQEPFVLWFTGLSGSGKSTLAAAVEKRLMILGKHTMLLDGDDIRKGLCSDLGFTPADRAENVRRVSQIARLINDGGLIVLVAMISPYAEDRKKARGVIGEKFIEIYIKTSLYTCEQRDAKGLYQMARLNRVGNFTGISAPYEPPVNPELIIDSADMTIEESVTKIIDYLNCRGWLS